MHPKHKKKQAPSAEVELGKIITPMLDMSFQLLSFFVFTFRPVPMEGQMSLNLPPADNAKASAAPPETEPIPDPPVNLTVVIREDQGGISSLVLKTAETSEVLGPDPASLSASLNRLRKELPPGQDGVKIETSGKLRYMHVVEVMDACLKAGFEQVGFAKPLEG